MNEATASAARLSQGDKRPAIVLQVLPRLASGGVERGTLQIAAALRDSGATALVASAGGAMERELVRLGVEHITLPLASKNPITMYRNAGRLARLIRERGVDLVHARSRAPAWSARAAARQTGCRFVTTFHAPYGLELPFKRRYNAIMTSGERVIAISQFIADHVRKNYRFDEERLRVIPRGVDLELFDPERVSAERVISLIRDWRLPDDLPVILMPGRQSRWKGQLLVLEALSLMDDLDFRCVLVGAGQGHAGYRRELEAKVSKGSLATKVFLAGACSDMPAAYKLADVVVSSSLLPEGFGRVVGEAQAMGRPVVVSDHGGAREQILLDETGFVFTPGDAPSLARALRRALALSPDERTYLHDQAIEHARRTYSKEGMCHATLAVYDELLASGGRP